MKPIFATFFVERERIDSTIGQNVLDKMDDRGHEVAVHGVDPIHHTPHQDTVDLGPKLEWMKSTINTVTGETPEHVRPPYGWVAWEEGIHSKPVVAAAYGAANLERYTSSHSTGGDNSWFGDQYTFAGGCSVCASQAEFIGYATDAIDLAVTTFLQARILLMHDIRPDDAANLGTIIDTIEDHADSKGVIVLYVPVKVIATLGI
jgi:peptidoglycan/xylan/chitin deacetylase (PgdA/CDA1 family)